MTFRLSYITYAKLMIKKKPRMYAGLFWLWIYVLYSKISYIYVGYTKTATGRPKFYKEIKKAKNGLFQIYN